MAEILPIRRKTLYNQSISYFRYRIENLITPRYWSFSVLIILTNQIVTFIRLKVFRKLWPFDLSRLHGRGDTKTSQQNHYLQNTAPRINTLSDSSKSWRKMQIQSSYKVHLITISNGEWSDPLCESVKRSDFSQIVYKIHVGCFNHFLRMRSLV